MRDFGEFSALSGTVDYDGAARLQGTSVEPGAFELGLLVQDIFDDGYEN